MKTITLQLHKHGLYSWVVKINTSEAVLSQYDGLGEYCGPHTASSVFLILVLCGEAGVTCEFCNVNDCWSLMFTQQFFSYIGKD